MGWWNTSSEIVLPLLNPCLKYSMARRSGALVRLRDSFKTNEFGWNHVEITSHSLYEYANYGFFVFLSIFERKEGEQCQ